MCKIYIIYIFKSVDWDLIHYKGNRNVVFVLQAKKIKNKNKNRQMTDYARGTSETGQESNKWPTITSNDNLDCIQVQCNGNIAQLGFNSAQTEFKKLQILMRLIALNNKTNGFTLQFNIILVNGIKIW